MTSTTAGKIGFALCRVVVPVWIGTGAVFKLVERSPRNLPKTILDLGTDLGANLVTLLAVLIGLEFLAVAVMIFVARFARPMAIFMLSMFCLILLAEMVLKGNFTSCGCFGKVPIPPWAMLLIDALLLAAVMRFRPPPVSHEAQSARWPIPVAALFAFAGFVASFGGVLPAATSDDAGQPVEAQPVAVVDDDTSTDPPGSAETGNPGGGAPAPDPIIHEDTPLAGTQPNPARKSLPSEGYWYSTQKILDGWIGRPWREIELLQFLEQWPVGLDGGTKYIVFFSRTCDHCEDMFRDDLREPELAAATVAIQVPDEPKRMNGPNAWAMPRTDCLMLNLPLGCDWIVTTPLALRVENGIVTCAQEAEHAECMGLQ